MTCTNVFGEDCGCSGLPKWEGPRQVTSFKRVDLVELVVHICHMDVELGILQDHAGHPLMRMQDIAMTYLRLVEKCYVQDGSVSTILPCWE